jgi:hypothetical protein
VLWMSVVVDKACTQILDAVEGGGVVTSLRVSPVVYAAVAAARAGEVARHYPLMLLGVPLVADQNVATYDPVAI